MVFQLDERPIFPHPTLANPDGLLAVGGDLSPQRLLAAYYWGIFPWYNPGEEILWWCPLPRFVIFPDKVKIAKSMRSYFNQQKYRVTYDTCFEKIVSKCGTKVRREQAGTWITKAMKQAYVELHRLGVAHSVEVWEGDRLVGGLYGVALGKIFFGESMYADAPNASKFGFITLCKDLQAAGFWLIDCQLSNPHLVSLGGEYISSKDFLDAIVRNQQQPTNTGSGAAFLAV